MYVASMFMKFKSWKIQRGPTYKGLGSCHSILTGEKTEKTENQ